MTQETKPKCECVCHTLTAREHIALGRIMDDSGRERSGDGKRWSPWERSWVRARNSVDGRTYASLYRKGLIECDPRGESPRYRWRREP